MINNELIKKLKDVHLGSQLSLYMSKKLSFRNYDIYFSDVIKDTYWNFATNIKTTNRQEFTKDWQEIKQEFIKYEREPAIYITPDSPVYNIKDELGLNVLYIDSWLMLDNLSDLKGGKSKLNISIEKVNKNSLESFIEAVSKGFSSDDPNEPYSELDDTYKVALRKSFEATGSEYKMTHYIAKYNSEIVATATVIYNEGIACIYNVTTKKEYKHNGICREIMTHLVKDMESSNIKIVCLQTEKSFYTEEVYMKLGFKKVFEGIAYGK